MSRSRWKSFSVLPTKQTAQGEQGHTISQTSQGSQPKEAGPQSSELQQAAAGPGAVQPAVQNGQQQD